jgi:hypothetical protein
MRGRNLTHSFIFRAAGTCNNNCVNNVLVDRVSQCLTADTVVSMSAACCGLFGMCCYQHLEQELPGGMTCAVSRVHGP